MSSSDLFIISHWNIFIVKRNIPPVTTSGPPRSHLFYKILGRSGSTLFFVQRTTGGGGDNRGEYLPVAGISTPDIFSLSSGTQLGGVFRLTSSLSVVSVRVGVVQGWVEGYASRVGVEAGFIKGREHCRGWGVLRDARLSPYVCPEPSPNLALITGLNGSRD